MSGSSRKIAVGAGFIIPFVIIPLIVGIYATMRREVPEDMKEYLLSAYDTAKYYKIKVNFIFITLLILLIVNTVAIILLLVYSSPICSYLNG